MSAISEAAAAPVEAPAARRVRLWDIRTVRLAPRRRALAAPLLAELTAFVREFYPGMPPSDVARYLACDVLLVSRGRRDGRLLGVAGYELARIEPEPGRELVVINASLHLLAREARANGLHQLWSARAIRAVRRANRGASLAFYAACESPLSYVAAVRTHRRCWPRHDRDPPPFAAALLAAAGRAFAGGAFDPAAGVVRTPNAINPARLPDLARLRGSPHVRFFVDRNPGYAAGDGLVVVGLIDLRTLVGLVAVALYRGTALALLRRRRRAPQ